MVEACSDILSEFGAVVEEADFGILKEVEVFVNVILVVEMVVTQTDNTFVTAAGFDNFLGAVVEVLVDKPLRAVAYFDIHSLTAVKVFRYNHFAFVVAVEYSGKASYIVSSDMP